MTIICAIAFSGAALSAQNETIKVSRNGSDTLVIVVKEKSIERQAKKEQNCQSR